MPVIKVHKNSNYTVMSNIHLRDKELSLKAKGLLSVVMSLPENWDYSIAGLVAICKENETAVRSALNELKQYGYLIIDKILPDKSQSGRFEYIYNFYEGKQGCKKQDIENLPLEILSVENQGQLNKEELSTYNQIIIYLNQKAGTSYRLGTRKTKDLIRARLNEGFTEADFYKVIDNKSKEWKGTEWEKYLRPQTLFGTKFEAYLNQQSKSKNPFADMLGAEYEQKGSY